VSGIVLRSASPAAATVASRWSDPRTPLILVAPSIAFGVLAELSLGNAGVGPEAILTDAASGFAFVLAGLAAWHRRPANRSGPLMLGIGLAWFAGDFLFAPVPLVGPTSFGAQAAARILFAWLLLAFPSGTLESSVHRAATAVIGAMAIVLAALQLVAVDPAGLCPCPSSPFAVALDSPLAAQLPAAGAVVGIGMTLILVPLVVRRMVLASGPRRRTLIPVLAGGAFSLLSVLPDILVRLGDTSVEPIGWLPIVWVGLPLGFLVALLRARMAQAAVADLVIRLGSTPQPQRLRDALASALGDPSLELLAWSAEHGSYVAADGSPVALPEATANRAVSILESDRGTVGAIVHDPHLLDNPGLVASVVAATRLAVENEQLHAEVEAQLAEVQASRARIVTAGDAERRRLERDLHDGAQQRLVALSLALRRTRTRAKDADPELGASLDEATAMVHRALEELRELARGIHPAVLTESGLAGAISSLTAGSPANVTLERVPSERVAPEVEAAAYFFVSEALANVAKHAPGSNVTVRAELVAERLELEVVDDGPGGASTSRGSGLLGLEDRVAAIGGRVEINSRPGRGTGLRAWLPLTAPGQERHPPGGGSASVGMSSGSADGEPGAPEDGAPGPAAGR
jgi:signal transduction histidine kinase